MSIANDPDLTQRRATAADIDALVDFTADVLRHQDAAAPDHRTGSWTRDLLEGRHPRVRPEDFSIVVETRSGRIVSSAGLISQTWAYDGVPFEVGQPELIGTAAEYRGRGLVRAEMASLHQWSAERGQAVLAIDGVPWFYRQFGYEMAVDLRGEISIDIATLRANSPGAFRVRPATTGDLAFMMALYDRARSRDLLSCERDASAWHLEFERRHDSFYRLELRIIESVSGSACGFLAHAPWLSGSVMQAVQYELDAATAWSAASPDVLAYLRETATAYARRDGGSEPRRIGLCLGYGHPALALARDYGPQDEGAYAWYLRVAALPAFVQHVAPVLERRLAASSVAGYSGSLLLSFYRDGLRLDIDRGRIRAVSSWRPPLQVAGVERNQPTTAERFAVALPGLTFIQLLFGYRSLDELRHAFPDCIVRTSEAQELVNTLFPKRASNVWALM